MTTKRKPASKKASKTSREPQKETHDKPVVTQVVEVVVEDAPKKKDALEEIKKDAQNIEETVEELQIKPGEINKEESAPPLEVQKSSLHVSQKTDEKAKAKEEEKEVIEELFEKREPGVAPEITEYKENGSKSLVVWVLVVVGVAVLTGLGLLFIVQGPATITSMFVKPTPTQTPSPTPTPASMVKKEDLKIQVLNGSGKIGAAAKMKSYLEDKGYAVSSVGNADTSDFKKTEILVKKDKEGALSLFKGDLEGAYSVGTASATLTDSSSYDARITVGQE